MSRPRLASIASRALLALVTTLAAGAPSVAEAAPDAELFKAIDVALEKGRVWLKAQRGSDGLFEALAVSDRLDFQIGMTSLCSLALMAAGEPRKDPGLRKSLDAVVKADAALARNGSRRTYDTGVLLMFLTELFRPEPKPSSERYAKPKTKNPCGLPKDLEEVVEALAGWLVSVQLADGWWRYPVIPPGDLSNTQYALLGLRAARDCGIAIPPECFKKALERTIAAQEADGPKMRRLIKGSGKPGERDYVTESGDRARGWRYQAEADKVSGSMTGAGIAVCAIAADALTKPTRHAGFDAALETATRRSVQDGFAWLDRTWAVDKNPPSGAPTWHYYHLYGLERAATFAARDLVGTHDWYVEGAAHLVRAQKETGAWSTGATGANEVRPSDALDTAFALLFLGRASRPTAPVQPPVITGGG